jgi:hypothetical protein
MHDRITAIGGTLTLHSAPSHGTRLHGTIPNPWPTATTKRQPPTQPAPPPTNLQTLPA